jgi:DNA-binding CsgD family transcriptional regulator
MSKVLSNKETQFYEEIFKALPATVYLLKIDKNFNSLPIWVNSSFERIMGYNLTERQKLGYAGSNGELYHPDDIKIVKNALKSLLDNPHNDGAIFFRLKTIENKYQWIYMMGRVFKKTEDDYQFICIGMNISDNLTTNYHELILYLKEISRQKNRIKLCKLTVTEKSIIQIYGKGLSTKEVASKPNRSYETINNHKRNIFEKLGIHKITELISFAEVCGLI